MWTGAWAPAKWLLGRAPLLLFEAVRTRESQEDGACREHPALTPTQEPPSYSFWAGKWRAGSTGVPQAPAVWGQAGHTCYIFPLL